MRKLLLCVTLLLPAGPRVRGQEGGANAPAAPPPYVRLDDLKGEAARLLESQANRERAWGAYLAGRHGLQESAPALVRVLSDPALGEGAEEKIVRQAALDALIRLGARVPAETLRALPPDFADEAVILLAAAPEENAATLLEMFGAMAGEGRAGTHWLAAGNLLAATKARGFAAVLLRDLKVEADIAVLDSEEEAMGFGVNGSGGCGCCAYYNPPEGFPPVSFYGLTNVAERDAVVVAPGSRPLFYQRSPTPYGGGDFSPRPDKDVVRVEYLAHLLDTTEDGLDFDARVSDSVVCNDARQCRRALAGVRTRIERAYAAMVGRLVENGHLDGPGDAPPSPPMSFTLWDHRRHRTFPLPDKLKGVAVRILDMQPEAEEASGAEAQ